jgi:hypothetical protein
LEKGLSSLIGLQKDDVYALIHEFDETSGIPDMPKRDQYLKVAPAITSEIAAAALENGRKSADMLAADLISNGLGQHENWRNGNCQKSGGLLIPTRPVFRVLGSPYFPAIS